LYIPPDVSPRFSNDVPNLVPIEINVDKNTLTSAALTLEEIFNDDSLKKERNIENWGKWHF